MGRALPRIDDERLEDLETQEAGVTLSSVAVHRLPRVSAACAAVSRLVVPDRAGLAGDGHYDDVPVGGHGAEAVLVTGQGWGFS